MCSWLSGLINLSKRKHTKGVVMRKTVLLASLGLLLNFTPAYALIPNGDFETGDLSGYFEQEDFADVPSSPLVKNVDDGTGNRVGEIFTGFTSNGVTVSTLARDFGTLPADVQDLFFDIKFVDVGPDNPPIFALASSPELFDLEPVSLDRFDVSLLTDSGNLNLIQVNSGGIISFNPSAQVENLPNGFYRVRTDLSGFSGATNSQLFFDVADEDDQRLSKGLVDNIDLASANQAVAPEPASMLLIGGGLMGFGFLRKKKLV